MQSVRLEPKELVSYFEKILGQAQVGITITDPYQIDNPIIFANEYFYEMFGYDSSEIIGKNCRFLQQDDTHQEAINDIRVAIKKQKPISTILRNYTKSGVLVFNQLTISPIYDDKNKVRYFMGVQKNITQEYYSVEQVKTTESLAGIGYWEFDIQHDRFYWSDQIFHLFGIDKKSFTPNYVGFLNAIHPEDREMVNAAYQNSLDTKEEYSITHRLLTDGRVKYVESRCNTYFDSFGNPLRSIGTIQDISYIKKVEIELKEALAFLKSHKLAIDESSVVSRTDKNGVITYVNHNFCKLSGYSQEELLGKAHSIMRHPENPKSLFIDLWQTIRAKKVWHKTIKNIDKFGKTYWVETTILPILNQDEEIEEFIAVRYNVTQRIQQEQHLKYIAQNDTLTGLGNRYKLLKDIQKSGSSAVAIIDIDNFSHINDFYGHAIGDVVLREFGLRMSELNSCKKCELYHLSGDEYVVMAKNSSQEEFISKIRDLEEKLSKSQLPINDDFIIFNFSIGISFESNETILSTADMALKIAKRENKSLLVYSEDISLNEEYVNNLKWKSTIKEALETNRVVPLFQPIVNNATTAYEKYESLVRIQDGQNYISPFYFLEISKKTRYYSNITKVMIQKSFDTFHKSQKEFSINLTIKDIVNDEINNFIFETLEQYAISHRVVFEIVESESIENFASVSSFIHRVKSYGCKIAIDDFGTGYSNFHYLTKLSPDYIKIDGSLIKNILTDQASQIVVKNLVNFAKDLNMKTIAEFVENEAIFEKVKALGIDYSQGYYFSAPTSEVLH